jgi:hypothetical protein
MNVHGAIMNDPDPDFGNSVTREPLAHFGKILVKDVRDYSIRQLDRKVDQGLGDDDDVRARALLEKLGPEAKELLKTLIPELVDTTLHYVMWMFEHPTHNGIRLSVTLPSGETVPDLNAVSDGLAGDLVAWVPAYAKERHKPFPGSK